MILKYNLIHYETDLILGRDAGFLGFQPNLRHNSGSFGLWNICGKWFTDGGGFGSDYNTNYELAIEVKPGKFKIWLNGKLMRSYYDQSYKIHPYINFGDPAHNTKFYLNDIFCINKSEFLPDIYTVNWNEPWFDLIYKPIYIHNEDFYSK